MGFPSPYLHQRRYHEEVGNSSGSFTVYLGFDEVPEKDDLILIVIGAHVTTGQVPFTTPTIIPGANVLPDITHLYSTLCYHDTDVHNSSGGRWALIRGRGDGENNAWGANISWQPGKGCDITVTCLHIKGCDGSNPYEGLQEEEFPGSANVLKSPGVAFYGATDPTSTNAILQFWHIGAPSYSGVQIAAAGVGSGTLGTHWINAATWGGIYDDWGVFTPIYGTPGTTGSMHVVWTTFTIPSGAILELVAGTTGPSLGSIRSDAGAGWRHMPDFEGLPWASDGRVLTWGNVRKKVSDSGHAFAGGIDALEIADTDQVVWGSTFGAGGTSMLWRNIQINSKWVQSLYGTRAGTTPLALGRVAEFRVRDNKITLGLFDPIEEINNAQFIWDYIPLAATDSGGTIGYGTVIAVSGSTVIVEESPDDDLRKTLNGIQNLDINRRTFTEKWRRLGNLGAIGTDSIVPGDIIKFSTSNLAATDAGSVLLFTPEYTVQSGSFFISNSSARKGTFGTIEFQAPPVGVSPGDFIYKRKPLWYRGNPAQIVWDIIHGTNTNLRWATAVTNATYFGAATSAMAQMDWAALITHEGRGGVIKALKDLSDPVDAVYFFDRVGSFCWVPYRPRCQDSIDFVSERYDGTMYGGTAGTGNMWNAEWKTVTDDILTDITVNFDYNHFEDESGLQYRQSIQRNNLQTATYFRGFRRAATVNTEWVKDLDEAVIIAERKLRMGSVARPTYTYDTSLYGIESDLYQLFLLSHHTGSMKDAAWQVSEIDFDIDGDMVRLKVRDLSDLYFGKGYGYFEDSALASHTVSGTSRAGWGWVTAGSANSQSSGTIGTGYTIGSTGSRVQLWDRAGGTVNIGTLGETAWITIGSEVLKIAGSVASATYSIETRGAEASDVGSHDAGQEGWVALPMDSFGDLIFLYSGTEFNGTGPAGTVLNINTATWGTVWRFW